MERKFKVGDRVNSEKYGNGIVQKVMPKKYVFPIHVMFDGERLEVMRDEQLTLLSSFEPQTLPTEPPKYDRAMIAAMCLQVLCSMQNKGVIESIQDGIDSTAKMSVMYADALITELEKPKQ